MPLRVTELLIALAYLAVGIINAYPVIGVVSGESLSQLYGIPVLDAEAEILLRHRAVLFGLLGGTLIAAAFRRAWRPLAGAAGLVSMLSFIAIARQVGDYGESIQTVVTVDLIASAALAVALLLIAALHRADR